MPSGIIKQFVSNGVVIGRKDIDTFCKCICVFVKDIEFQACKQKVTSYYKNSALLDQR